MTEPNPHIQIQDRLATARATLLENVEALTDDLARDAEELQLSAEAIREAKTLPDLDGAIGRLGRALEAFMPVRGSNPRGVHARPPAFERAESAIRTGLNYVSYLHRELLNAGAELPEVSE